MQDSLRAIAALNRLMHDPTDILRFTVGTITTEPGTSNTVARKVVFTIDLRHPDKAVVLARGDAIAGVVQAAMRTCTAAVHERFHALPVDFGTTVPQTVADAAKAQGMSTITMPSGAFHDAQFMVPVCPTGMVFIPCRNGVSHHPAEYAEPVACANGARVLTQALLTLAAG